MKEPKGLNQNSKLIEIVRSFNRIIAERLGVLNDHYLGRNHPLGEARLVWEVGEDGSEVRDLRRRLGLDSGYLSRLLRSLEKQGLVTVRVSDKDGRVRMAKLTRSGLRERTELDRRSDALAISMISPLSLGQRDRLVSAMKDLEQLLTASMVTISEADPSSPDVRLCFERYYSELAERFDTGFDPTLTGSANSYELRPPNGIVLLARQREEPLGCGAIKFHENAPGEIKRMWVAPKVRGCGVGRRILEALELYAKEKGVSVLHLETNRVLNEALRLYRKSGYREVEAFNDEAYAHHWFEKHL